MRLTILGGGGFRVPLVHRALTGGDVSTLTLYDTDPARLGVVRTVLEQSAARAPQGARLPRVRIADGLDDALRGADFVFSAIRVGGTAGRVRDERVPLAEGVLGQETVGAGGVLYGLRTVPVAQRIAERAAAVAPGAWVINFTNPAGMVTEAMSAVLGGRVIGICDSPVGLVRRAARAAGADPDLFLAADGAGAAGGPRGPGPSHGSGGSGGVTASYDYLGLNHLGWLRTLHDGTRDLLPGLLADDEALGGFEEGRLFGAEWLRALGALPNEYLHYYYFRRETLAAVHAADETRGAFLDRQQSGFFAQAAREPERAYDLWEAARRGREETYMAESRAASGGWQRDSCDLDGGGYDQVALALMRAIGHGRATRLILNVPNGTTVPALPEDAVIETVCDVDERGARPRPAAPLGAAELGLVLQLKAVERAAIRAALLKDRQAALRALAWHPLVDSPAVAARILDRAART